MTKLNESIDWNKVIEDKANELVGRTYTDWDEMIEDIENEGFEFICSNGRRLELVYIDEDTDFRAYIHERKGTITILEMEEM